MVTAAWIPPAERSPVERDERRRVKVPKRQPGQRRRLISSMLLPIIESLCRETGKCYAKGEQLRGFIYEDYGYPCGERSIPRAIKREVERGRLLHKRIRPNRRYHPKRKPSYAGTQWNWFPSEAEKREKRWRDKTRKRIARQKSRAERRALERAAKELVGSLPTQGAPPSSPATIERTARRRASVPLLEELVEPRKLAELLEPPPPAPVEQATFDELAERRRGEVERQLAALRAADHLRVDRAEDEEPPDR